MLSDSTGKRDVSKQSTVSIKLRQDANVHYKKKQLTKAIELYTQVSHNSPVCETRNQGWQWLCCGFFYKL